jgi:hypothetical protein
MAWSLLLMRKPSSTSKISFAALLELTPKLSQFVGGPEWDKLCSWQTLKSDQERKFDAVVAGCGSDHHRSAGVRRLRWCCRCNDIVPDPDKGKDVFSATPSDEAKYMGLQPGGRSTTYIDKVFIGSTNSRIEDMRETAIVKKENRPRSPKTSARDGGAGIWRSGTGEQKAGRHLQIGWLRWRGTGCIPQRTRTASSPVVLCFHQQPPCSFKAVRAWAKTHGQPAKTGGIARMAILSMFVTFCLTVPQSL